MNVGSGEVIFHTNKPLDCWHHGDLTYPKFWPWWKHFHLSLVTLGYFEPGISGIRLWVYTRYKAKNFDIIIKSYRDS